MLLEMMKWSLAALPGSDEIQGVLDQAISTAQQQQNAPKPPPPPDPKIQVAQIKGQIDMQKEQAKLQADMTRMSFETQQDKQRQEDQTRANVQEQAAKEQIKRAGMVPAFTNGSGV